MPASLGNVVISAANPQTLAVLLTSAGSSFTASVGWPALLEARVVNDCGNPVTNALVVAAFSNGDPAVTLISLRDGRYTGTWTPRSAQTQVVISLRASLAPLVEAQAQIQVTVGSPAAVVNGASFAPPGQALSPGSLVSFFGQNLAATGIAETLPLPTTLGGSRVTIGGINAPLFYSSAGQINAQLPTELPANTTMSVMLHTDARSRLLGTILVGTAQPGILTQNQQGTGPGVVLGISGLVSEASPARPGDTVAIYGTGFGATDPAVPTGAPFSQTNLSLTRQVATVRIGGVFARVFYSGGSPNFVGLYQVHVVVPEGVQPGPAVPVVLNGGA